MKESGGSSNFQNQSPVELEKTLFEKSKSKVGRSVCVCVCGVKKSGI